MLSRLGQAVVPAGDAGKATEQARAGQSLVRHQGKRRVMNVVRGDGSAYGKHLDDQEHSDYWMLI